MELKDKILGLITEATKVDTSNVTEETHFTDDLNLDSLDMVELMMKMEDEFGIEIPENDTEKLQTVGAVLRYLKEKDVQ